MKQQTKKELFLALAQQPDKEGFSREVFVKEFTGKYKSLILGNGGSWCRSDSPLGKEFNIERHKEKGSIDLCSITRIQQKECNTKKYTYDSKDKD